MKIGAIIFCRIDSTRLPGKALLEVNGKPLLSYVLAKCRSIFDTRDLVVATTGRKIDDSIVEYCKTEKIIVFRGSVNDVAARAIECAKKHRMDYFYRINADSPLIDKVICDKAARLLELRSYDLVTNLLPRSFPYGISVELIRTESMVSAYADMRSQEQREHITKYFYTNIVKYDYFNILRRGTDMSNIRLTIDYESDLHWFEELSTHYESMWTELTYQSAIKFLRENNLLSVRTNSDM